LLRADGDRRDIWDEAGRLVFTMARIVD